MNMNKTFVITITLFILSVLISCRNSNLSSDIQGVNVDENNWNTSFVLRDDPALLNTHKNGETLFLRIDNLSDETIVFPDDFGVKVITNDGQNWIGIQNNIYYTGPKYLPIRKDYPLGLIITVLPYIPDLPSSTTIRIIIVGYAENNDKDQLGSYLDIMLNP